MDIKTNKNPVLLSEGNLILTRYGHKDISQVSFWKFHDDTGNGSTEKGDVIVPGEARKGWSEYGKGQWKCPERIPYSHKTVKILTEITGPGERRIDSGNIWKVQCTIMCVTKDKDEIIYYHLIQV